MTYQIWLMVLLSLLGLSLLLCFVRLYLGPNPPNRTVAFDTIAIHAVGIMALFTMIASNRLQRREGTQTYELTEQAKRLLEYIDEYPRAHALSILPMSKVVYWHNAIHADHSHLLS